jgi:ankyrin repeat protein
MNDIESAATEAVLEWDERSVELSISSFDLSIYDVTTEIADPVWVELCSELFPEATDLPSGGAAKTDDAFDQDVEDSVFSDGAKRRRLLPYASSISEYFQPNGSLLFRPRPEWWRMNTESDRSLYENRDTILHAAIRENATEAALALIEISVPPVSQRGTTDTLSSSMRYYDSSSILVTSNQDGITPLILASQKGNVLVVQALLRQPLLVDLAAATPDGTTPLIEAARFGRVAIMELLLQTGELSREELVEANVNDGTTALMYAAQEGNLRAVECLLRYGAAVNRENRDHMTALLLAAHRGHATTCQQLLHAGANVDHVASRNSTALVLACQRGHVAVVQVLVAAGCTLHVPNRNGRMSRSPLERRMRAAEMRGRNTRLEEILRLGRRLRDADDYVVPLSTETQQALHQLLDPMVQVDLMQQATRMKRNRELMRMHTLLQQHRAQVRIPNRYTDEDDMIELEDVVDLYNHPHRPLQQIPECLTNPSTEALMRTMTLPPPLVHMISLFLTLPELWDKRIDILRSTALVNANEAIFNALDLLDEVLEESGFLTACDVAQVPAPIPHASWADWKCAASPTRSTSPPRPILRHPRRISVTEAMPPPPQDPAHPTIYEMRRQVGYLSLLAQYQSQFNLLAVLTATPYRLPQHLLQRLIRMADIASIARRCGDQNSVRFEAHAAMDIIQLASRLCSWYSWERDVD